MNARVTGRVISAHGRHYMVELPDGTLRHCYPRGKKGRAVVGDDVEISLQGDAEGAIEAIRPRRNLLYRSDDQRSKQFAANIDQVVIVVATEPDFSADLVGRALIAARSVDVPCLIILNKIDRPAGLQRARDRLAPLRELGLPVLEISALDSERTRAVLYPHLSGRTSLLLGPSGMGKSTILNTLVPDANAATREHSSALGAGRHTTTHTQLYRMPPYQDHPGGEIIDSPGFQEFGLLHLNREEVERGFPEFAPHAPHCRFYDCTHRHEPDCGVLAALNDGEIAPSRYALYRRLLEEIEAARPY